LVKCSTACDVHAAAWAGRSRAPLSLHHSLRCLTRCINPTPLRHPPPAKQDRTGIPAAEQLLTYGGRPVASAAAARLLAPAATLDLSLRLAGGKGGFGALLRGQGRDGKITDNFDACRDLQGRRIRQVEAEQKLKDWAAQAKERELEKVAEKHIRDLARQQRQEKDYEVNVEAVREEQRAALERVQEAVQSALAEGLGQRASGSGADASSSDTAEERAAAAGGSGGDSPTAAAAAGGSKRKAPEASVNEEGASASAAAKGKGKAAAASVVAEAKRPRKGGMLDLLEGSDEDEDDSSEEED